MLLGGVVAWVRAWVAVSVLSVCCHSVDLTCHSVEQQTFLLRGFGALVAQAKKRRLQALSLTATQQH